ncbi:alpha-1,2-fucosyltransferase [Zhouia sp. PK063]|uniref:alpha-1,2-fucosyltransferase n=1 Tax=Zhouia sp. PK063 TaxID=3373602 RepID=UPI0037BE0DF7
MVIFSRLGKKGNLGNQLFQIASTIGIAERHKKSFGFPQWKYATYFAKALPSYDENLPYQPVTEKEYKTNSITAEYIDYDLSDWFQSENYFNREKLVVKHYLKFNEEFYKNLKIKNQLLFSKRSVLISVRRGDFVNHPHYYQLSYRYYILALLHNFPDYQKRNLIFTSDDINYCKTHFSHFKNAYFVQEEAIKQLVLGTMCDDFIISNSTFSWWQAWLGEKDKSKIIRPVKNYRGKFSKKNNDKDFFPKRWECFNHTYRLLPITYLPIVINAESERIKNYIHYNFSHYKYKLGQLLRKKINKI